MKRLLLALTSILAATNFSRATDIYFAGDGSALTAVKWGTSSAGPFTSSFSSGNTAVFATVNGTGSGATGITVSGIRAEENFTYSSPSGTLSTGGTVASIDVFSGKKLDLTGVAFSTAAGTGFNKTGAGTLVITTGGTYAGGFTLTSGTVIVGGVNALGSGGALNLNGGILAVNNSTSRDFTGKYTGGISIGGNIQLGDSVNVSAGTGNMTFSNTVALGNAVRTITVGGSGTYTFNGAISGSSGGGLNITNSGGGTITLGGTNTYTGGTTVSSGTLTVSATGALASTGALTVNGGTLS